MGCGIGGVGMAVFVEGFLLTFAGGMVILKVHILKPLPLHKTPPFTMMAKEKENYEKDGKFISDAELRKEFAAFFIIFFFPGQSPVISKS